LIQHRIADITQRWFLAEPLLFGAWCTHRIQPNERIETIRVGRGLVEFNSVFLSCLDPRQLQEVLKFEALRIVLKHPYERRKPNVALAWEASNLAIREAIPTTLPMLSANERFGNDEHDRKFFEYYYNLLCNSPSKNLAGVSSADCNCNGQTKCQCGGCKNHENPSDYSKKRRAGKQGDGNEGIGTSWNPESVAENSQHNNDRIDLKVYCDGDVSGVQNAIFWDYDQLLSDQINDLITEIDASQNWGTIAGSLRELILASRIPRLDYRRVLRTFRSSILAANRRLTRMKPNRRYGIQYMGSRRDFCTKILFAVDVSGSVGTADVCNAFSIINRFFNYGIETIDVVWFDTQIRNEKPLTLKRARQAISVEGRGGTCFQPLMDHLDENRDYDGLIVFTDGIAPVPDPPKRNRRTRIVWLINHESNWKDMHENLEQPGMSSAFVMSD
jgi:predicted metal-dependent peptidase